MKLVDWNIRHVLHWKIWQLQLQPGMTKRHSRLSVYSERREKAKQYSLSLSAIKSTAQRWILDADDRGVFY